MEPPAASSFVRTLDLPPVSRLSGSSIERRPTVENGLEHIAIDSLFFFRCSWAGGLRHGKASSYYRARIVHEVDFERGERTGRETIVNEHGNEIYCANWKSNRLSGYVTWFAADGKTVLLQMYFLDDVMKNVEFKSGGEAIARDLGFNNLLVARYNQAMVRTLIETVVASSHAIVSCLPKMQLEWDDDEDARSDHSTRSTSSWSSRASQSSSQILARVRSASSSMRLRRNSRRFSLTSSADQDSAATDPLPRSPSSQRPVIVRQPRKGSFVFVNMDGRVLAPTEEEVEMDELQRRLKHRTRKQKILQKIFHSSTA